jgi:hypothetical protein
VTREDVLKLEAGPEMDRLVAEKVMGWAMVWAWVGDHSCTGWKAFPLSTIDRRQ